MPYDAEGLIQDATDQFRLVATTEAAMRSRMLDDFQFSASKIWPVDVRAERESDGRPCLDINRIPQFLNLVINQIMSNRPSVQVNPVDSGADVATAEAIQGIIRSIEVNSDADVAYWQACVHQVTMGRGYWRILTEYADDFETEQDLVIRRIRNPFTVYVDPTHQRSDASDARYAFIIEDIPRREYERRYGKDSMANVQTLNAIGDKAPYWLPEGSVRTAEYFYKTSKLVKLVRLELPSATSPGTKAYLTVNTDQLPDTLPDGWRVVREREADQTQVKWARINGVEILDGNEAKSSGRDWPSKYIPIIQALGTEYDINGEIDLRGMVRDAKDPQRMYCYWASALTEMIALAPRAPYIGFEGSFKGHEQKWLTANRKNYPYLEVAPLTIGGQPAPFPQRTQFSPDVGSIVEAFKLSDNDLKAVMGLYDPSLGQSGPEQSGKAILARQRQGEIGNSQYAVGMSRAIRHNGRVLLDMIPRVMSPHRILRVLGVDDKPTQAIIHVGAPAQDMEALKAASGVENIYDISVGRYDVSISTGPSFASRRQESVDAMLQLINTDPQIAPLIADLVVKNMDWPGAGEIAARLKKAVPPQLLDDGQPAIPPQVQQRMQQLQQQVQQLTQERETKILDIESKERIESANLDARKEMNKQSLAVQLITTKAKIEGEKSIAELDAQIQMLTTKAGHVKDIVMAHIPPPVDPNAAPAPAPTSVTPTPTSAA